MIDGSELRDLIWEARWDALGVIAQAVWTNVLTHWWFGPLLLVVLLTLTRKAWVRLLRQIGVTFIRGHRGD